MAVGLLEEASLVDAAVASLVAVVVEVAVVGLWLSMCLVCLLLTQPPVEKQMQN